MTDTTLNRFFGAGSHAARLAFSPSVPVPASGPATLYGWFESDTKTFWLYDTVALAWYQPSIANGTAGVTADVGLTAGKLVTFTTTGCALADVTDPTKPADGYVIDTVLAAASVGVYLSGSVNSALSGLTPGTLYYLGASGAVTATPTTTSGQILQPVGKAITATAIAFQPGPPITI